MADELDKFVLQYTVDLKDSISRLEQLQKKVETTGKKGAQSGKTLKESFEEAVPAFGRASSALGKMGTVAGAAAATFALLAASVKAVNKALSEYNARAELAYRTGVGTIAITQFERNMRAASGGRVNRAGARTALGTVSDLVYEAYTDPTRQGTAARKLQRLGVNPVGAGGAIAGTDDVMAQLSKQFAAVTKEQAAALGQIIGLTPQATEALRNLATQTYENAKLTDEEAMRKERASEASLRLQGAYNDISESFNDMVTTIGESLMPSFADMMEGLSKLMKWMADATRSITDFGDYTARFFASLADHWKDIFKGKSISEILDTIKSEAAPKSAAKVASAETERYKKIREITAQETLNINTFASAVNKFAGTVDIQRAWAAWAGEVGRAGGIGGAPPGGVPGARLAPGEIRGSATYNAAAAQGAFTGTGSGASRGIRNNNPGNIEYGPFARSMGATGSDGRFAVFPTMQAGEAAMRALLGGKGYMGGGRNTIASILGKYAPSNENNTKAYVAAVAKQTGIDPNATLSAAQIPAVAAAMMVHESGYRGGGGAGIPGGVPGMPAPLVDANNPYATPTYGFSGPVLSFGGRGESRESVRYASTQQRIAARLPNIPLAQLQQGQATRGDVAWAGSQEYASLVTDRANLIQQLKNPSLPQYSKELIGNELRDVDMAISNLMNFMPTLLSQAKAGGRSATLGDIRIQVNAGAVSDPHELARLIRIELQQSLRETVNQYSQPTQS
ncbi:hypothetical protein [Cupriavidus sp. TMH.W2]|uniref:hypothetical protein n=1 Tax=Cupriavidus sp. TMH.W2 TaxID=3434465 RepID=UPI003D788CBC